MGELAVKLLEKDLEINTGESLYEQFCSKMGKGLSPHLVQTFYAKNSIVVMKCLAGDNIRSRLRSDKVKATATTEMSQQTPWATRVAMEMYFLGLLLGLKNLHDYNIAHGDIKPENIMCNQIGEMVIVDLELSRHTDANGLAESHRSGTASYMPLELLRFNKGDQCNYKKADIWAMGLTILEALVGPKREDAYSRNTEEERFSKIIYEKWSFQDHESMEDMIRILQLISTDPDISDGHPNPMASGSDRFLEFIGKEIEAIKPSLSNTPLWKQLLQGMLNPNVSKRFTVDQALELARKIVPPQNQTQPDCSDQKILWEEEKEKEGIEEEKRRKEEWDNNIRKGPEEKENDHRILHFCCSADMEPFLSSSFSIESSQNQSQPSCSGHQMLEEEKEDKRKGDKVNDAHGEHQENANNIPGESSGNSIEPDHRLVQAGEEIEDQTTGKKVESHEK
jgi:serine/threonine protein kinase